MYSSSEQRRRERVQVLADKLYRDHYRHLLRIALRNAANRADAEEAVQFALLAFLRRFDPNCGAPPLGWLVLTLKRECWAARQRHHLDRAAGQQTQSAAGEPGFLLNDIPAEASATDDAIERAEWLADARRRLAALRPAERRALVLIAAGYSYREVGQITGWTHTKINRVATEGRAKLRQPAAI